jgi:GT2 family glycosyltransferase
MTTVVACVPSVRAAAAVPTLLALLNQSFPVAAILVHDESRDGLLNDPLAEAVAVYGGVEVLRPGSKTAPDAGYSGVNASRGYLGQMADVYRPDWLWFVDDDVFPLAACLERLLRGVRDTKHVMASATLTNLLPGTGKAGSGGMRMPPRNHARREGDTLIPTCSGDCFLVRPGTWAAVKHDVRLKEGGEDVVVSGTIATRSGPILHVSAAIALHLRSQPSPWQSNPVPPGDVWAELVRFGLDRSEADRLLAAQGETLP